MKKLNVLVEDVRPGAYILVAGHYARVAEVKSIGDWTSFELHTDQDEGASTLILPSTLPIEILLFD